MVESKQYLDYEGLKVYTEKLKAELNKKANTTDVPSIITIDSTLSTTSTNPVQNKVIKGEIDSIKTSATNLSNTVTSIQNSFVNQTEFSDALNDKVDKVTGKTLSTNDYTTAEKNKLAGIAINANNYTLPAASSTQLGGIKVGNNLEISTDGTLSAVAEQYTLPTASSTQLGGVKVGTNLSISNGVLSAKDTTYSVVSTTSDGLMSSADKSKLDGISSGATKVESSTDNGYIKINGNNTEVYTLPYASSSTLGGVKVNSGDVLNTTSYVVTQKQLFDILGGRGTLPEATTEENGLMSASDKKNLNLLVENGVFDEEGKLVTDSSVSTSSANPVQNQAITNYVNDKVSEINVTLATKATTDYVNTKISQSISGLFRFGGSKKSLDYININQTSVGTVFNMLNAFTTDTNFIEGSGNWYPAGTNIVVVKVDEILYFDVLAGTFTIESITEDDINQLF